MIFERLDVSGYFQHEVTQRSVIFDTDIFIYLLSDFGLSLALAFYKQDIVSEFEQR